MECLALDKPFDSALPDRQGGSRFRRLPVIRF
jgi:hypothetical protein